MGTRLELVLAPAPITRLEDVARSLIPLLRPDPAGDVIAYLNVAEYAGLRLLSVEVSAGVDLDIVAQELSRSGESAIHLWYSDSVNEAGYAWFHDGVEIGRGQADPAEPRMYLTFQDGLRRVFPSWSDLDPDDAIDVIYSSEEPSASFVLARAGLVLADPALYVPPAETPHRPSPFDREFAWGQLPRRILRAGVVLYGAILVAGLLFVLLWWAWETLRP